LRAALRDGTLGQPLGLAAWLVGTPLAFPLGAAITSLAAVAHACENDAPADAARASRPLLGLGPGLTPSGDDFVGAVFFARAWLAPPESEAWQAAGDHVVAQARERTHPISVALLSDLVRGEGHAPLHDLAQALIAGAAAGILEAASRLTRLGHSSGWDLLAGIMTGVLGGRALTTTP
jgi:hypothetical protein